MKQVQMTDQHLNRALAELMEYTIKELPIGDNGRQLYALVTPTGRERLSAFTVEDAYLDAPDYCTDPAASLEVQEKAIGVDPKGYVKNLCFIKWGEKQHMGGIGLNYLAISRVLTSSPRERAEAAYITLSSINE